MAERPVSFFAHARAALSEGLCPRGHGSLTQDRTCLECNTRWEMWKDSVLEYIVVPGKTMVPGMTQSSVQFHYPYSPHKQPKQGDGNVP